MSEPAPIGAPAYGEDAQSGGVPRSRLVVSLFGGVSVQYANRDIAVSNRKAKALLGYLAFTPNLSETRERLVGVLWSENDEGKARASLRQALHALRDVLAQGGFKGFLTDRTDVSFEPGSIKLDTVDVLDSIAEGKPHDLLLERQRLTDTLMAGYEDVDPSFRIWLLAKRQSFHERIARGLESALREGQTATLGVHERTARALQNLDPTHEQAARALIRTRAEAGDVGGALGIYKALWDRLDDEYDVEPSKETQELIAAIKLGQPEAKPAVRTDVPPTTEGRSAAKTIALPVKPMLGVSHHKGWPKLMVSIAGFDGSATQQEHRYLVDGFRRELIACLVRFREWVVRDAAPASAAATPQSADGAEYMVEASAFEAREDALRLVITLRDLATNAYLWSERLNVSVANWFEAQQHVVRRITTALNVHLSAERMVAVAHRPPGDLKTYDLWLLGQATFLSFDPKNWERARNLFRQVIAQMPDFAPAYSSLAQLNNSDHIVRPGVFRDQSRSEQSLMYAREAARLDPIDSRSQLCLGWSHAMVKQYEQAMIFISLAYELNENDPWTLVSSAGCFAVCGQYERAREIAEHALRLPLAPSPLQWAYHVSIRFMGGDYVGAVQAADAAGDVSYVPGYKASALFHLGDRAGAAAELRRFIDVTRRKWVGTEPATDANITRWLLTMIPIRRPEDWQRARDGLAGAGAPVEGLAHHQW